MPENENVATTTVKSATRILLVEDNSAHQALVAMMLRGLGFTNLTFADNGVRAWELLENTSEPFDLIISDLTMPDMTGINLLKQVRASRLARNIPFIMITASRSLTDAVSAKDIGVTRYMFKPFTVQKLDKEVNACLEKNVEIDQDAP